MWDQQVPYDEALAWQRSLRQERLDALKAGAPPPPDVLLLMQHPPVLTLGTSSTADNMRSAAPPFPVVRTERGGEVTYHGPGQLVLYPLLDLRGYAQDVRWYMGALEEVAIRTCASLGLRAVREPGLTGVWVDGAKVCAMGVKISRWLTMHGLSLNVCPDLSHFGHIVPCGLEEREVTSLHELLGGAGRAAGARAAAAELVDVQRVLLRHFADVFDVRLLDTSREKSPVARSSGAAMRLRA
jgi:lipoyl(octanoyl) transferase